MAIGNVLKMKTELDKKGNVSYHLPLSDELIHLNPIIGKKLKMRFTGKIHCIDTGGEIKKSYHGGYSYESFIKLPECDTCIMKPEECHYHLGTCRDPSWGEKHCMKDHVVYLSVTSDVKVGITRQTQVPTRWIDQGAKYALALATVPNRFASGLMEVLLKDKFKDKTNWRVMLKGDPESVDLISLREELWSEYESKFQELGAIKSSDKMLEIKFPLENHLEKINSFNFDKEEYLEETLTGIKGQYLIFETVVLNVRKFQGYEIEVSF